MNKNKQDIIEVMAGTANISKVAAKNALNAFIDCVMDTLQQREKVSITGFGGWEISCRAARSGRNPQTGQVIDIPATMVPKFKAGKKLKNVVNGKSN